LRGGTVAFAFDPAASVASWTPADARFSEDVAVSGSLSGTALGQDFDGTFSVVGPGPRTQTMRITGPFLTDGADMTITLDVAGRPATFTVAAY
jgi:hypothetical protein